MFRVGDRVECTNPGPNDLTKGKLYEVLGFRDPTDPLTDVRLVGDNGLIRNYNFNRFILAGSMPNLTATVQTANPGDTVECINDYGAKGSMTQGKNYTVVRENGPDIIITDDRGISTSWNKLRFVMVGATANSVPSAANPKSDFSVGDRIRYIGQCYAKQGGLAQGATLTLNSLPVPFSLALATDDKGKQWSIVNLDTANYTVIISGSNPCTSMPTKADSLVAMQTKRVVELKPCTCDSLELSRKGCMCGAIVKQQWGLRA